MNRDKKKSDFKQRNWKQWLKVPHYMMEWEKEIEEKSEEFFDKLKKVKEKKDYGITSMRISESTIYPELMGMKQEIWLSDKDKIVIKYEDKKETFEISLNFEEKSLYHSFDILLTYLNMWCGGKEFNDKVHISIKGNKLPIKLYYEVEEIVKRDVLESEEIIDNKVYSRVLDAVWINIDNTIEIINNEKDIDSIKIVIEKVNGKNNKWEYISCLSFSYESKYYEDGYLTHLEDKRIDECKK